MKKQYSIIKNVFLGKFYFFIAILFLILFLFNKVSNWRTYNVLSTDSKYELSNRENYSFYKECREYFKYYYKNIKFFITLNKLLRNEPNLCTLANFKICRMPFRSLGLGDAHFIINEYASENWFEKKNFHLMGKNENIQYLDLLKKYGLNSINLSQIENTMKETSIEVVNRYNGYVELCWESPFDNESLDWYNGYLMVDNKEIVEIIKHNYRYISQVDDNCFYFWKDVKK